MKESDNTSFSRLEELEIYKKERYNFTHRSVYKYKSLLETKTETINL